MAPHDPWSDFLLPPVDGRSGIPLSGSGLSTMESSVIFSRSRAQSEYAVGWRHRHLVNRIVLVATLRVVSLCLQYFMRTVDH